MNTLLVCTKCFKAVGKKAGWKRSAINDQIARIAADQGLEVEMTGCLDVCPDKGVTVGVAESRRDAPSSTCVLAPKNSPDEALAAFVASRH